MSVDTLLVEAAFGRASWKVACRAASDSDVAMSGVPIIDTISLQAGDRVLLTAQADPKANGPWTVQEGIWTRPTEFDSSSDVQFGSVWRVLEGGTYGGSTWQLTSPTSGIITLGSTALTITQDLTGSTGVEAPTPSSLLKRTTGGAGRIVALSLETDTTSARWIGAFLADAVTLASLAYFATTHFLRGASGGKGGILITPGDEGSAATIAAKNADGVTTKPLDIVATSLTVNGSPVGSGTPNSATPATIVDATTGGSAGTGTDYLRADTVFALPHDISTNGDPDTFALRGSNGELEAKIQVASGTAALSMVGKGNSDGVTTYGTNTLVSSDDLVASVAGAYVVEATAIVHKAAVLAEADAGGLYARTSTPAAATTIVYGADVTSVTESITQRPSGAGATRSIRSGRGASGSASGNATFGLPASNDTLGAKAIIEVGTPISNVTDPVSIQAGGTEILKVVQSSSSQLDIDCGTGLSININRLTGRAVSIGNASISACTVTSGAAIFSSNGYMTIGAANYLYLSGTSGMHRTPSVLFNGWGVRSEWDNRVAGITTATTTYLWTYTPSLGEAAVIEATITTRNTTDGTSAVIRTTTRLHVRNDGGVLSVITAATIATATGDATEVAQVAMTLDTSGTTVRLGFVTSNAKTRDPSYSVTATRAV